MFPGIYEGCAGLQTRQGCQGTEAGSLCSSRPVSSSSPVVVHTEAGEQQVGSQARY